jgi:hypothetical protein
MRFALIAALVSFAGCRGKQSAPAQGSAGSQSAGSAGSAGAAVAVRDAGSRGLTMEQRNALAERIKAGVDLRKQQKWNEAIAMFQSALEISPGDPRVLQEMGWCAIKQGDVEKAKQCLASLDEKPAPEPILEPLPRPAPVTPFCAPEKTPCDCIIAHAFPDATADDRSECAESREASPVPGVPGFQVYATRSMAGYGGSWKYLLDENHQLVGVIGGETEHGKRSEQLVLDKAEVKTIGGHRVLWLQTTGTASATYAVGQEGMQLEDVSATYVTLCVLGDTAGSGALAAPTSCPVRDVPIHRIARTDRYETVEGKPKTERVETTLDLAIAADGTVTVTFKAGEHDAQIDAALGKKKLW